MTQKTTTMYVVHPILGLRPQSLSPQVTFIKIKVTIRNTQVANTFFLFLLLGEYFYKNWDICDKQSFPIIRPRTYFRVS